MTTLSYNVLDRSETKKSLTEKINGLKKFGISDNEISSEFAEFDCTLATASKAALIRVFMILFEKAENYRKPKVELRITKRLVIRGKDCGRRNEIELIVEVNNNEVTFLSEDEEYEFHTTINDLNELMRLVEEYDDQ